ncbi:MAG: phosphate propanoyltransferase [bacterium]|nr:phosphate propanoyltransferase [bacterium]
MQNIELSNYSELVDLVTSIVREKISQKQDLFDASYSIPVGVSNRHIHVTRESLDVLYGKGYELNPYRYLSQPGEFAAKEALTVVGPKMRAVENIRILGPIRSFTQVELSLTDGIYLGIELPIRISGDVKDSTPVTIIGPKGVLHLKEGAIRSARHIHMTPADAGNFNVKNGDEVRVEIAGEGGVIFKNVHIRVSENYKLDFHIDTDEGNCANVKTGQLCKIVR